MVPAPLRQQSAEVTLELSVPVECAEKQLARGFQLFAKTEYGLQLQTRIVQLRRTDAFEEDRNLS
jgi:hypothetical protein